jgi:hypothetical protein
MARQLAATLLYLAAAGPTPAAAQPSQPPATLASNGINMSTFLERADMVWDWELHANASEVDSQYVRHEGTCAQLRGLLSRGAHALLLDRFTVLLQRNAARSASLRASLSRANWRSSGCKPKWAPSLPGRAPAATCCSSDLSTRDDSSAMRISTA